MYKNKISIKEIAQVIDRPLASTCKMMFGKGKLQPSQIERLKMTYPQLKEYGEDMFYSKEYTKKEQL